MRVRTRVAGVAAAALLPLTIMAAPAQAVGDSSKCRPVGNVTQTNSWHVFWSRDVRAYEHACLRMAATHGVNFMYLAYVQKPRITFPSAWPIPSGEKVTMTRQPWVSYQGWKYGKLRRVTWAFSAQSCTQFCTHWDFKLKVDTGGTTICQAGGACDKKKAW